LTCKKRRPYNLYCVGGDVKPFSINQSVDTPTQTHEAHHTVWCATTQHSQQITKNRLLERYKKTASSSRYANRHEQTTSV